MENPSESGGSFDASGAFHGGTVYSDDEEVLIKLQNNAIENSFAFKFVQLWAPKIFYKYRKFIIIFNIISFTEYQYLTKNRQVSSFVIPLVQRSGIGPSLLEMLTVQIVS